MDRKTLYDRLDQERDLQQKWDHLPRSERPLRDAEKPVEFWIHNMRVCLENASNSAYNTTDKTEALKKVYETLGLGLACLEHNGLPEDFFTERYKK